MTARKKYKNSIFSDQNTRAIRHEISGAFQTNDKRSSIGANRIARVY